MKEQLYTIPLNDAVNAGDECPFCFIERSVEQDLLDFVLGSGSSYMEADIREMTDKAGFCRQHFQKMFDYGNTLGNAWILKTHYQKVIGEMKNEIAHFKPAKTSLKDKLRKAADANPIAAWVRKKESTCYICDHFADTYARYMDTFFYLWNQDSAFRQKIKDGKGFCLHHFGDLCQAADAKLSGNAKDEFYSVMFPSWRATWDACPRTWPGWWRNSTIATRTRTGRIPKMPYSGACRSSRAGILRTAPTP